MSYTIPDGHDLRPKLTPEQRAEIHARYNNPLSRDSLRALAREFDVSKRLIQFIVDPAKHEANLARRRAILKERGSMYYNSNQAEYMRRHRARLLELNTPETRAEYLAEQRRHKAALKAAKQKGDNAA